MLFKKKFISVFQYVRYFLNSSNDASKTASPKSMPYEKVRFKIIIIITLGTLLWWNNIVKIVAKYDAEWEKLTKNNINEQFSF